jgi:hypothetical protein
VASPRRIGLAIPRRLAAVDGELIVANLIYCDAGHYSDAASGLSRCPKRRGRPLLPWRIARIPSQEATRSIAASPAQFRVGADLIGLHCHDT